MITYQILPGKVDVSVTIRIIDSTDGTPETGVVYNTSGIDLEYRRESAASTDITEATLAALTTAHADGGFLHIGNGYYRLDLPDAACAAGVPGVLVHGTVTGMIVLGCYIQLEGHVNSNYARIGAPAGASVSADVAAVKVDTAAILVDTGTTLDGRIPAALVSGRMDSSTGAMATNVLTATAINADAITAAKVAADVSAEIADAVWDEDATGHQTTGTFGQAIGDPVADTNTIYKAVVTDAAGATIGADVVAVKADTAAILIDTGTTLDAALAVVDGNVDSILVDTAEIGTAGAGLTNINLPNQTMDIVGNITGNLSGSVGSVTALVTANMTQISGDSTAADNLETAFDDTAGAVPWMGIGDQGTAQSATGTTVVLRAGAAFADSTLIGKTIDVFGSTQGYWQTRVITANTLADDTVTVATWTVTPSGTITYKIYDTAPAAAPGSAPTAAEVADAVWDEAQSGHVAGGSFGETATEIAAILVDTGTTLDARIPAALVSGRIDASVGAMATNVLTATAINADAITAAKVAADVSAEIADAVWDEDATGHQTTGTFGQAIGDPVADTNTIYKAVVTDAAGATVGVDVVAVKADTAAILVDTGTTLDARIPAALVSGRIDASVGAMAANVMTAAAAAADLTTELQSGLATAAALATVDGIVDDILLDTAEIGVAGAGLTNINLPNQTMDIVGSITGNLSGSVGSVTGAVGSVTGAVGSVTTVSDKTGYALSAGGVDAILDEVVEGAVTLRESARLWNSAMGSKASGLATTTAVYRDLGDTKDRITATVDSSGNRSAVTHDLT